LVQSRATADVRLWRALSDDRAKGGSDGGGRRYEVVDGLLVRICKCCTRIAAVEKIPLERRPMREN